MTLTFGSLFSGIGGLDLGLERAGMRCLWQVEIDEYCRRVLAKHWPDVPKYGDIRELTGDELERVDLICGGFPCQDISNAGKRAGIDGERSGLWREYIRVIRVLRPRFVLVENVAALLGRGLGAVLGDLAACGYDAEWDCLPASAFGAPHRRDRLFIVAHAICGSGKARPERARRAARPDTGGRSARTDVADPACIRWYDSRATKPCQHSEWRSEWTIGGCGGAASVLSDPDRQSLAVGQVFGGDARAELTAFERSCRSGAGPWVSESGLDRVVDGISGRVDRIRGLGNAVVPQVAEWLGWRIVEAGADGR